MKLPTYASGSGASSARDAAAQDDMPGTNPVKRGDAARGSDTSFARLGVVAADREVPDITERTPRTLWPGVLNVVRSPVASCNFGA